MKPLSLLLLDNSHCLIAWCLLRADYRTFRLDRMAGMEVLETSFRPERVPMLRGFMARMEAERGSCAIRM